MKLIAATNADLAAARRAREPFAPICYARLNPAARLLLPPLRERIADLEELMRRVRAARVRRGRRSRAARGLPRRLRARRAAARVARFWSRAAGAGDGSRVRGRAVDAGGAARARRGRGTCASSALLIASAAVFALGDALRAVEEKRAARAETARVIPIPAKLVHDLLAGSWERGAARAARAVELEARATLRRVAQDLERQLYERLYAECGGDFAAMAKRLLTGGAAANARRVRLRFNQLGLRSRKR